MSDKAVRQYLQRHAEVEAGIAESLDGAWDEVVVIPAYGESAETLEVLGAAASGSGARVLAILVVNSSVDSSEERRDKNRALIAEVSSRSAGLRSLSTSPPIEIGCCGGVDWLVIDRSGGDHALPSGQGVGLARKIGCDIALACLVASKVRGRWIYTTDADVVAPRDYFHPGSDDGGKGGAEAALTYRFRHEIDVSTRVGRALGVYDVSLRYYVLGLAAAGSPYAFQTIGSTLALCPMRYAQVRGFPRRLAAEDFYLLNKLAKVGSIVTPRTEPIRIRQRQSDRVPFGTGRATTTISALDDDDQHAIYDARCFRVVARWMELLRRVGSGGDAAQATTTLRHPEGETETALAGSLDVDAVAARLEALSAQHARPEALRRALFTWFDGWQTLKLIHAVRDRVFPSLPWREALRHAWFLGAGATALAREPVQIIVERLASLEESAGEQARGVDTG